MSDVADLSNPDVEPTDEQLVGLSRRAFAGVRAAHEEALRKMRDLIERERAEVLRALAEDLARERPK